MSYQTIKVWQETYRRLKVLAAKSGELLVELIDRLSREEEQRQKKEGQDDNK